MLLGESATQAISRPGHQLNMYKEWQQKDLCYQSSCATPKHTCRRMKNTERATQYPVTVLLYTISLLMTVHAVKPAEICMPMFIYGTSNWQAVSFHFKILLLKLKFLSVSAIYLKNILLVSTGPLNTFNFTCSKLCVVFPIRQMCLIAGTRSCNRNFHYQMTCMAHERESWRGEGET